MMNDEEVVSYFNATTSECYEETKHIKQIWQECWEQYMCRKDFSKKKDWQFKTYTPISKPKIKKATRLIKRVLLSSSEYFDFDTPAISDPERVKLNNVTKRVVKAHLTAAKFIDGFAEALESGFTMAMMILKFWVGEEKEHFSIDATAGERVDRKKLKLKVKAINPFNFDFTRDGSIQVEHEWITLAELRAMAEKADGKLYHKPTLKKILDTDYAEISTEGRDEEEEKRIKRLGLLEHTNSYRKQVKLSHFWGPLQNKDNQVVMEHCQFTVVNDKHLFLKPRENPYWHEKSPYVWGSPLNVLFRHIGKGLTEDVRGIEDAIIDFVNLQLDNQMWQLLGVREVDEQAFTAKGKSQLMELTPGKLVAKRTGYQGQAFKFHEMGVPPEKAMSMLGELKQFHEEEHGVTQFVSGGAQQRGDTTLGEYQGRRFDVLGDFQSIALDIERSFLNLCIDRARDLVIQYLTDFEDNPEIVQIFKDDGVELAGLTETQRRAIIVTELDFVGKGISIYFEREEKLNKMGAYVKGINAMPEDAQLYVKWPEVFKRWNEAYAWNKPEDLTRTDEEVKQEQQRRQQRRQQQQQQQLQLAQQQQQQQMQFEFAKIEATNKPKMAKIQQDAEEKKADQMLRVVEAMNK
jgi:hypothetical protein